MINNESCTKKLTLEPDDTKRLANLCGQYDEHIKQLEKRLGIVIHNRGNAFQLTGNEQKISIGADILQQLYLETEQNATLSPHVIHLYLQEFDLTNTLASDQQASPLVDKLTDKPIDSPVEKVQPITLIQTHRGTIKPRGTNQQAYVRAIEQHDINFGIGPAGTGKTYLAVACAVAAWEKEEIRRILLVRPAVEAGEKLGFLPGDLAQKIDPYLRPLYDALYEMLGFETVGKLIERNIIEVAPLAYMRGRTLNNAFIILDESQNTTREQMKMFLTRIGFASTAVITGDITQVDLPRGTQSGLLHAMHVLEGVKDIGFTHFSSRDVVRHPLVQRIVEAYDLHEPPPQFKPSAPPSSVKRQS